MYAPAGFIKQEEIATSTSAVANGLAPDVVRIRHDIDEDWSACAALLLNWKRKSSPTS